jgi:hypothetical protein
MCKLSDHALRIGGITEDADPQGLFVHPFVATAHSRHQMAYLILLKQSEVVWKQQRLLRQDGGHDVE